jgi:hypothetical protein
VAEAFANLRVATWQCLAAQQDGADGHGRDPTGAAHAEAPPSHPHGRQERRRMDGALRCAAAVPTPIRP